LWTGFLELVLEWPFSGYKEKRNRANHHPALAVLGLLLLGALLGAGLTWAWPLRVLPVVGVPGASLLLSPIAAGLLMAWWGRKRRAGGHPTTSLATWYGGAAFAFGAALARHLMVG
jgi:hypothetical protein